jgi:hypothetical protein
MGAGVFRLPRRGRARLGVVATIAALVIGGGVIQVMPAFGAGSPSRPVDTDINKYVLFALDSLHLKSGNDDVAHIKHGNIGVNNAGGDIQVCGGGGNGAPLKMDEDGSQVVADEVTAQANCNFWDVFANTLNGGSAPVIRNSGPNAITSFPIITTLPSFPDFSCSAGTGQQNLQGALAPGVYGDVHLQGNATLTNGTYTFCSLNVNGMTLTTAPGTVAQIVSRLQAGNGAVIGPACSATFYIKNQNVGVDGPNFNNSALARNSTITGHFWAPNGSINLGHSTNLYGNFWSKELNSDFDVNVDSCTPDATTTTSTSTTTTTIPITTTTIPETTTTSTVPETTSTTTTIPETTTSTTVASSTTLATTTTIPQSTTVVTQGTTATTATTTTVPGTVTTLANTTTTVAPILPFTGSDGFGPLVGVASLGLGGTLLLFARRRSTRAA